MIIWRIDVKECVDLENKPWILKIGPIGISSAVRENPRFLFASNGVERHSTVVTDTDHSMSVLIYRLYI